MVLRLKELATKIEALSGKTPHRLWCVCVFSFAVTALGDDQRYTWSISASYLSSVMKQFSERHNISITYEEPIHPFSGDLEDIAPSLYPTNRVRERARFQPVYVGRPVDLNFEYELDPTNITPQAVTAAISKILDEYNAKDYPGKFKLKAEVGVWHVIPEMMRDANGDWSEVRSFLDQEVELQATNAHLIPLLGSILEPASAAAGWPRLSFRYEDLPGGGPLVHVVAGVRTLRDFVTDLTVRQVGNRTWQLGRTASETPGKGRLFLDLNEISAEIAAAPPRPRRPPRREPPTQDASYVDPTLNPVQDAKNSILYRLNVEGERPLQLAIQGFMQAHHAVVTYEDPFYEYLDALVDRTAERKDLNQFPLGKAPRLLEPKETRLQADYQLGAPTDDQVDAALQQIVEQYNRNSLAAQFRVQKGPGCWHVIPDKVRNMDGHWQSATNHLDARIQVEGGETNIIQFVESALQHGRRNPATRVWMFADMPPLIVGLPSGDYVLRDLLAKLMSDNFIDLAWSVAQNPSDPPAGGALFLSFWLPLADPKTPQHGFPTQ